MQAQRSSLLRKREKIEGLSGLLKDFGVVFSFRLSKVRSILLHRIRRKFRGQAEIVVCKKTTFVRAAEAAGRSYLTRLVEGQKEPVGFILTDESPFKLSITLERSRMFMHAKAGESADIDVVVPECNTGLPPGPVLSEFGSLGIPTKIEGGNIWIARDTLVAEAGDSISAPLASLLSKLDIKVVRRGLDTISAFEGDVFIDRESLVIDLDDYRARLLEAVSTAFAFGLQAGYPTADNIRELIGLVVQQALYVGVKSAYPSAETMKAILQRAESEAIALSQAVEKKG